jgi:toxin ParE1/3/4
MRWELSPQAETDLREIGDYIARDNPDRAASFVAELLARSKRISERPAAYPTRPERRSTLLRSPALRHLLYGQP